MGRTLRVDVGGSIYHVWNRSNASGRIFLTDADYEAFEYVLIEAKLRTNMRIFGYCIMPNHWHFVVMPEKDGDLVRFFTWLTLTHTQRWHTAHGSVGEGHIYQGRYKSNLCQNDTHFIRLVRYVERNALRANLADRAENWRWSSGWRRTYGSEQQRSLLAPWPVPPPEGYSELLNTPQNKEEMEAIRLSLKRGRPYGAGMWMDEMVRVHELDSTIRSRGRPIRS